ncbi:DUF1559 domain-containing protein [Rubripirellula reticaptiva]|uniref:DUF1559 domain-containing protein n=1 Tax=Rubripirellula reticaptiva TaxID=2528013 RepID=A0A5C6ERW1_9BACT|nr:DUF1559 domain-containing protein [Rubripirellula reticaptiva]TWU51365.1 hypothetical protein Poly59_29570 [Rubripirellula reticaptiva]
MIDRRGLTVLELLVTMVIIAILVALVLPAIGSAREAGRRIVCVDHLREVGLALHNHHNARESLPVGWTYDLDHQSAYGWAIQTLPFLSQPGLFDSIDSKLPIANPAHTVARQTAIQVLLCPSDITEPSFTLYKASEADDDDDDASQSNRSTRTSEHPNASPPLVELPTANYVGVFGTLDPDEEDSVLAGDGAFVAERRVRFRDFQRGLSNTLMIGERTMAFIPSTWLGVDITGEDATGRLVGSALEGINHPFADECEFSSRHPGGANFLWGDGHVSFIAEQIDLSEYHALARLLRQ